jgi:hypothetical protein
VKLHQLSIFIENRPGQLMPPCRVLADAGINIVTLSLADTERFGILRLIVRDWQAARDALADAGFSVNVSEVVAIEVDDRPGGLVAVLDVMSRVDVNVEYMYAFLDKREDKGILVFRFADTDAALRALDGSGLAILPSVDLYERLDA